MIERLNALRRILRRWRGIALALGGLALCEVASRIVLPSFNSPALRDYFNGRAGGILLRLYDGLVGGALSRGTILAIGIMPYLSARVIMWLSRAAVPAINAMWTRNEHQRLTRWTRILTGGLALVQSYGFARFVQNIPGVVANPGPGFVTKTMLVLTAASLSTMWIAERFELQSGHDEPSDALEESRSEDASPAAASQHRVATGPSVRPPVLEGAAEVPHLLAPAQPLAQEFMTRGRPAEAIPIKGSELLKSEAAD